MQSNDQTLLLLSNAQFEVFDRLNNTWSKWERGPLSNMQWRWPESVQLVGDKLIFMGGVDAQNKQTRLYDLTKGKWKSGPELNFPMYVLQVFHFGNAKGSVAIFGYQFFRHNNVLNLSQKMFFRW